MHKTSDKKLVNKNGKVWIADVFHRIIEIWKNENEVT